MGQLTEIQPWPLVGWRHIVHAFRPDHAAREAPFRTLRSNGVLSQGIRFTRRHSSRLAGTGTLYSRLNLGAAVLHRRGDTVAARSYSRAAQRIEDGLVHRLRGMPVDTADLEPSSPLSPEAWGVMLWLCAETGTAQDLLPGIRDRECTTGVLSASDGRVVQFAEAGPFGAARDLPWGMLEASGLAVGDSALLVTEFTGAGLITLLEPGLSPEPVVAEEGEPNAGEVDSRIRLPLGEAFVAELMDELRAD